MKRLSEGIWTQGIRRSSEDEVRHEDESKFKKYLRNVKWMDMGSSKYLYAKFDYPYSDYHNGGCSLNEIIEIQKELPKDVHIMTRSNLNWLKKNHCQFREINTDIHYGCSMMNNDHKKIYFSVQDKKWSWTNFITTYQIDHPVEDYCVSTEINLYNSRTGDHQFFKTPRNILTCNHTNRNGYIFTEPCLGFKLVKDKVIRESLDGSYKSDDEVKKYIDNEVKSIIEDNDLEIEFVDSRLYGSRVRRTHRQDSDLDYVFEYRGKLKEYVVFNIMHNEEHFIDGIPVDINPIRKEESGTLEEYTDRASRYVKEGVWTSGIRRSSDEETVRKEDEFNEEDRNVLKKYMELFPDYYGIPDDGKYDITLWDFKAFVSDFSDHIRISRFNPDVSKLRKYIDDNWDKGENIYHKLNHLIEVDECDVVSPNGGLVLGDVQGMGPITFPGECGEKGSGDLPMPTGKVYQQVAPFGTFIKMKKKKKKKFRKEDEPCAHSPNAPMYNYVDDYRDYVDRTYNKIK